MKLLLKGARIIDPAQGLDGPGDILLKEGKIAALGEDLPSEGCEIVDCRGLAAAPGLVDLHVHLRDPGQTHKEDLFSACRAAAAGGVTSLLAMPNTQPPMDSPALVANLLERAKSADAAVYTAACVTLGLEGTQCADYEALRRAGAVALSDDGKPVASTRCLLEALDRARSLGLLLTAHCEDRDLARGGLMNQGETAQKLGVKGIPPAAEDCGVARELAAAASIGAPIHICHVSTKGSVALIRDAKARGVKVTAETCPHYLLLTDRALEGMDADCRMNPPLGSEEDRQALIEGLLDGTLDAIATDHAPHTPEEKADFIAAPNGSIGMETSLAAVLTVLSGRMSLSGIIEKMSRNPAKILGIPGGSLVVGGPADVALFDPEERWTVDPRKLHGKSRNTPFKGMELTGRVKMTFFRGRRVF
ncbi:dihydroorotase [Acutalibacter sp. 1XD8-33]|uniref:dihydroorotase n=1 Tax=Acutalibacter sp. 1XD8-33 TaxID=2320081 RepID=UPI000EA3DD6D|nr:dihydroorotase [Acutalibacter sp. 1XD8-33]RKJ39588.1 dihydroorotase [Acutalibacter sp. 1XD8-33]